MAKCKLPKIEPVLLGYEDELITEKHSSAVGYWTNKIGGLPDWASDHVSTPTCQLCSLPQLLVVQIYAPLESSYYHRTLYIFCCINPNCWNLNESWSCYRSQIIDKEISDTSLVKPICQDWCAGADDWDDDNGNSMPTAKTTTDSDDSSSLSTALGSLRVDQCNANWSAGKGPGAVGKITASAEIEGDEGEVITIDTPTTPQHNLIALLEGTAPLPNSNAVNMFIPSFIWVCEEDNVLETSEHVRGLLNEYQANYGEISQTVKPTGNINNDEEDEKYERTIPAHGDAMFHGFISRVQANPGHVLRYSRGAEPLLVSPLEAPRNCQHCQGEMVFELQILPTILNKLRLSDDNETHLDFGNVVIYTCKNSCWASGDSHRNEIVCVQAEMSSTKMD